MSESFNLLNPKTRAILELIFAGAIWGFGYVATVWALLDFSPVGFLVVRFIIAWVIGEFVRCVVLRRAFWDKEDFWLSFIPGLTLAGTLLPQSIGLLYTSVSNSGVLTVLYVVIVPILAYLFFQKKASFRIYALAGMAFFGALLLMRAHTATFNAGDLWTLLCAFSASLHIIFIGRYAHRIPDPFRFNNYQSLWCLLFVSFLIPFDPDFSGGSSQLLPWIGILATAIGSTLIGFLIQIRAQRVLSETTAAQLFLLESPFALMFGFLIFNERIVGLQSAGAAIILLASYLTLRLEK